MNIDKQILYREKVIQHLLKNTKLSVVEKKHFISLGFLSDEISFRLKDIHSRTSRKSHYTRGYLQISETLKEVYGLTEYEIHTVVKKFRKRIEQCYYEEYNMDRTVFYGGPLGDNE